MTDKKDKKSEKKTEKKVGKKYIIRAEVFGIGILQWLKSQGSMIKILAPTELIDMMVKELDTCRKYYKK